MFHDAVVDLLEQGRDLAEAGRRVSVLWQHDDTLVFLARGREYRSEFHINPSDETMQMIKGEMRLHYRTTGWKRGNFNDRRRLDHLHARRHASFTALSRRRFRIDFREETASTAKSIAFTGIARMRRSLHEERLRCGGL